MTKIRKTTEIKTILEEREKNYGDFVTRANVTMALKLIIHDHIRTHSKEDIITGDQLEALDMICSKIGRIINGNPNHIDSWIDIAGYAKLVSDRLENNK